jgi:hypothetical protein
MLRFVKAGWDALQSAGKFVGNIVNAILLSVIYLFGVGLTKVLKVIKGAASSKPAGSWKNFDYVETRKSFSRQF